MVYVLLGNGFEEIEALTVVDVLRRCGLEVRMAGIGGLEITGGHGITVHADCLVEDIDREKMEMLVLPGGLGGVASILGCPRALEEIRAVHAAGRYIAAICAGPTILAKLGITDGKKTTSYPGTEAQMGAALCQRDAGVVVDGKIATGRAAGSAMAFALKLAELLCGKKTAEDAAESLVVR